MIAYRRKLPRFIAAILAHLFLTGGVFACNPVVPTICEAYSQAKAVFVGKLIRMEKVRDSRTPQIDAHFLIEKVFKGNVDKTAVVRFDAGDCGPRIKVGERHFVYQDKPSFRIANRTTLLRKDLPDLEYAELVQNPHPIFLIKGQVVGLSATDMGTVWISITGANIKALVRPDSEGFYSLMVQEEGEYQVRVSLPFRASVRAHILDAVTESTLSNFFEYKLRFRSHECDFRRFEVSPNVP